MIFSFILQNIKHSLYSSSEKHIIEIRIRMIQQGVGQVQHNLLQASVDFGSNQQSTFLRNTGVNVRKRKSYLLNILVSEYREQNQFYGKTDYTIKFSLVARSQLLYKYMSCEEDCSLITYIAMANLVKTHYQR